MSDKDIKGKLQEALKQRQEALNVLATIDAQLASVKKDCEQTAGKQLLKAIENFANEIRAGELAKKYSAMLSIIVELADLNKNYQTEFNADKPYGIELSPTQKYFFGHLRNILTPGAAMVDFLAKIAANKKIAGSPFF